MSDDNQMQKTQSNVSLSAYHSSVFDNNDHEYVIALGYNQDNLFGYFLCRESVTYVDGGDTPTYTYTGFCNFFPKVDETSYQDALDCLQGILY